MATTVWKGSISFGLVSVPVRMFTATRSHALQFHQVNEETGARVRNRRVDEETGEEVERGAIVKSWETDDGRRVLVDPAELAALDPERSELLDIRDFVDLDEIDPVYYDRPYHLAPQGEAAAKAYRLLVEAMTRTNKVAIATFVLRNRQHLAALRAQDGLLVLSTMRYHDEVVDADRIEGNELVERAEVRERELEMAEQLIASLTTGFDPGAYRDEHRERVLEFLESRAAGHEPTEAEPRAAGRVIDLTEALEESLRAGA